MSAVNKIEYIQKPVIKEKTTLQLLSEALEHVDNFLKLDEKFLNKCDIMVDKIGGGK